jgi:hypothetical protein
MEHKNALPVGYTLEDYEIESILGHGGFGITYKARDRSLGSLVAIKEYLPQDLAIREQGLTVSPKSAGDGDSYRWGLERFLDEARTLARFKHPNIVRVVRYLQANNTGYTVMDYEEGRTLSQRLLSQAGALGEQEILDIFLPIMDGLREVHGLGLLHRDIKPGNIYLRSNGSPMLIDFGAARQAVGERSKSLSVIVTQGYAPLEQYSSRGKQGAWSDIYALGASMHRCISGAEPAEASVRLTALMDQEPDPLPPAIEIGKGRYSETLLQAIDWSLQVRAQERPQSVEDFQRAIIGAVAPPVTAPGTRLVVPQATMAAAAAASARASGAYTPGPAAPAGVSLSRKSLLIALGLLLLLPVLAVGGWFAFDDWQTRRELAQQARNEIDDREYAAATAGKGTEGLAAYLKSCDDCRHKKEAEYELDSRAWAEAKTARTAAALRQYAQNCGACQHKTEAEQLSARLVKELAAMERIKGMGNVRRVILVTEGYAGNCAGTIKNELRGVGLTSVSENDDYDAYVHASVSTPAYFSNSWASGYKARYSIVVKRIGDGKVLFSRSGSELGSSARDNCDDAAEQMADDLRG